MVCEGAKWCSASTWRPRPFINSFAVGILRETVLSMELHLGMPMHMLEGGTAGESEVSFTHKLLFVLLGIF